MTFSTDLFGDPAGLGDQWKAADHIGILCAFVDGSREKVDTRFGNDQDATKCRYIIALDGDDAGTVYENAILFGNISKDAYSDRGAPIVLGRVTVGQAKKGQNPPFILEAATDEDKQIAAAWFTANTTINDAGRLIVK